jgi:hypothetical protein
VSVFNYGREVPVASLYCQTCQTACWGIAERKCRHTLRILAVGDRIKTADGVMGTVDFVGPGQYGVTWDGEENKP